MSATVNKESPLPRYVQARRFLENLIHTQGIGPGDQLPSERELSARFRVSQMTMNRAIQDMVRDGILFREVGRGTFVMHQDAHAVHNGTIALVSLFSPGYIKRDPYFSEIMRGVQSAAFETGWDLLLVHEALDEGTSARLRSRADGFLFMIPLDEAIPALRRMVSERVPFVSVGSSWLDESFPALDTDNIMGAKLAVDHLVGLGHTRIGFVGAPENMSNSRDRHIGFQDALAAHGIAYNPDWFIPCASATAVSRDEMDALLRTMDGPEAPTAFFAAGYELAVHTIEALQNRGLSIPDDVSVVGFDDKFSAAFLHPPLTTVAQPLDAMGRRAVERLEEAVRGGTPDSPIERLPTRLVVRRSTAAPPRQ
ncbi:MAG TPA: GntR family transcriptional regulator [Armatimonadota bacterium]|jgi:DNA-binding LacI/PurR family transcriptional regulator